MSNSARSVKSLFSLEEAAERWADWNRDAGELPSREQLDELEAKLKAGDILCSGKSEEGSGRELFQPGRWGLTFYIDTHLGVACGDGDTYHELEFFEPGDLPSNFVDVPEWYEPFVKRWKEAHGPRKILSWLQPGPLLFAIGDGGIEFSFGLKLTRKDVSLFERLLPAFDEGDSGQPEAGYSFIGVRRLILDGEDDQTLRKQVERLRQRASAKHESVFGVGLPIGAIIENEGWSGYRLNPALVKVSLAKIRTIQAAVASPNSHEKA